MNGHKFVQCAMKSEKLSNIFGAIEVQMSLLSVTGCWPKRHPSACYRLKYMLSWCLDLFFQIFLFSEAYKNFMNGEYKALTELLSFMASEVPYLLKHMIFDIKSSRFLDALEKLKHPRFNCYPRVCDVYVHRANQYARGIMRFYQFAVLNLVLLYGLKPFFTQEKSAIRFSVFDLGDWLFPFHIYQVICIANACYNNSTLDVLSLGIMAIGSSQFEILREKIIHFRQWAGLTLQQIDNGVVNDEDDISVELETKLDRFVAECVQHHLGILGYIESIENVFTYYMLIQFCDSVLAICNTWFQFMLEDKIIKIMFLGFYTTTLLTQLGMYCVYGTAIVLSSEEIRDACYASEWYKCGNPIKKSLMLMMERAKRPSYLTAGKFSVLNLVTYAGLVRMSYSYFTLMNRLFG